MLTIVHVVKENRGKFSLEPRDKQRRDSVRVVISDSAIRQSGTQLKCILILIPARELVKIVENEVKLVVVRLYSRNFIPLSLF